VEVRHGEIVGLAGLLGSGRSETARALFGAEPLDGGTKLEGSLLSCVVPMMPSTRDSLRGPQADGIIPELSVRENLTLALPALSMGHRFQETTGRTRRPFYAASWHQAEQPALSRRSTNSGGNQQKVLRAMAVQEHETSSPRRADLAVSTLVQRARSRLIANKQGSGLMISSEVEELVEGSQRSSSCVTGGQSPNSVAIRRTRAILYAMAEGADREAVGG